MVERSDRQAQRARPPHASPWRVARPSLSTHHLPTPLAPPHSRCVVRAGPEEARHRFHQSDVVVENVINAALHSRAIVVTHDLHRSRSQRTGVPDGGGVP